MRRIGVWSSAVGIAVVTAAALACNEEEKPPEDCPTPGAAFVLTIRTMGAPLPADTTVKVQFGGGEEEYRLADPPASSTVLFCEPQHGDGGQADAGASVDSLRCVLWTEGSATVEVRASGYPDLTETLVAKPLPEECGVGVMTQEIAVELEAADGGV